MDAIHCLACSMLKSSQCVNNPKYLPIPLSATAPNYIVLFNTITSGQSFNKNLVPTGALLSGKVTKIESFHCWPNMM